jgi:hypothetical protein
MKTVTKFTLAALTAALLTTGSVLAGDTQTRTIDNHHGVTTYVSRTVPQEVTIAFTGHARELGRSSSQATQREEGRFQDVATPHGTVSYFAPVK